MKQNFLRKKVVKDEGNAIKLKVNLKYSKSVIIECVENRAKRESVEKATRVHLKTTIRKEMKQVLLHRESRAQSAQCFDEKCQMNTK